MDLIKTMLNNNLQQKELKEIYLKILKIVSDAKIHFDYSQMLLGEMEREAYRLSPTFFGNTIIAHRNEAIRNLTLLFDRTSSSLGLIKFLHKWSEYESNSEVMASLQTDLNKFGGFYLTTSIESYKKSNNCFFARNDELFLRTPEKEIKLDCTVPAILSDKYKNEDVILDYRILKSIIDINQKFHEQFNDQLNFERKIFVLKTYRDKKFSHPDKSNISGKFSCQLASEIRIDELKDLVAIAIQLSSNYSKTMGVNDFDSHVHFSKDYELLFQKIDHWYSLTEVTKQKERLELKKSMAT